MKKTKLELKLYRDLKKAGERYAGVYLVNKFFIRIVTRKLRSEIPSYDFKKHTFSSQDQMKLQMENYPTLFHEYVHYVHEVSTMAGISLFYFNLLQRGIFSQFVDKNRPSVSQPISGPMKQVYKKLQINIDFLTGGFRGDVDDWHIYEVDHIEINQFPAYEPSDGSQKMIDVPTVYYRYVDKKTNKQKIDCAVFGKYFLYEGLAHNLDQITSVQGGLKRTPTHLVGPEYRMLNMIAYRIFPTIDLRSLLELASMSLCFFNSGTKFISMLTIAATVPHLPGYLFEVRNEVYAHLTSQRKSIAALFRHIKKAFQGRREMHVALSHLCKVMLEGLDQRSKNPVFEIDVTYAFQQDKMRQYVDLCQIVYEFADDKNEFRRDFAGSYLPGRIGKKLLTFMCHVDYAQRSINKTDHCCPMYTFCPQKRRKEKALQCRTEPWLSFDDQPTYGWCEYGLGVAYMTGQDRPKKGVVTSTV